MLNIWIILSGLIFLFLVLAVRFKKRKSTIRVSLHGDELENKILFDLIKEFREKHPHIQVELLQYSFKEFSREVLAAAERGACSDVLLMEVSHYTDMFFADILEPIYPYFLNDHLRLTDFYPQVVDRFFLNGFLNAVPRDAAPICMVYYNKKAFDEAGIPYPQDNWVWDQFVETSKKLTQTDPSGKVIRWGFVESWAMVETWVYNAGGSFVDNIKNPSRWTFTEDRKSLKGLKFRWDLIHKHRVMPPPSVWEGSNDRDGIEMFANGNAAMCLCGLWKTPRFREIVDFHWDAAMIPRDPDNYLDFGISGSAYGMTKASRNKKAAWKFIKFVSSEYASKKMAETCLALPARMKIANSTAFLDDKKPLNKKLLLEAMKRGKFSPLCKNWTETKLLIDHHFGEAWEGKVSLEEIMMRLKPILEKNPPQVK